MKTNLEKVFFCTGARNHDLLKVFPHESVKFEYDERMASFKALGLAKIAKAPVAVCTTSGTAVSQCVSAMLEAYYSELPLVLITGDRPKKLHGTGSPQTIEHEALTRSCRRTYLEIELSELAQLDLSHVQFPVHVNVLVDDTFAHDLPITYHTDFAGLEKFTEKVRRPVFLFSHESESLRPFIEKFRETKLPFYAETLSGAHELSMIRTEKKLIELFSAGFFDSVIRIGHTPLSKVWRLLEKKPLPVFHIDSRGLPALSFGDILARSGAELLGEKEFWRLVSKFSPVPVADETLWQLEELVARFTSSEITLFSELQKKLPDNSLVYLGNSLVIRFFELTQTRPFRTFGNRGVNGIDGQLASAIGLAMGTKETVYCILGDVTTFYDLSSLRELPSNMKLIIMNNGGGRIFDMLKLDKRIILEHEQDFRDICAGLKLTYSQNLHDLDKVQVLELHPSQSETEKFLTEWNK